MGLPGGRKSFKMVLAVLIQYRRVTDSQPPSQPRRRSKYALCISASRSNKRACVQTPVVRAVGRQMRSRLAGFVRQLLRRTSLFMRLVVAGGTLPVQKAVHLRTLVLVATHCTCRTPPQWTHTSSIINRFMSSPCSN